MVHLINRLKFEFNCPGEDQAFQLRHSFQDTLQEQIIKVVDQVCTQNVPPEEWIQIDRIEIDAGSFSSNSLYEDFAVVFRQKFEEELTRKLSIIPSAKRETSRQDSWIELFIHFLQTGTLPWWAAEAEIDLKEISTKLFNHLPIALSNFFYANRFQQHIWTRAAFQLDDNTKAGIISFFEILIRIKEMMNKWAVVLSNKLFITWEGQKDQQSVIDTILIRNAPLIFGQKETYKTVRRIFTDHLEQILSLPVDIPVAQVTTLFQDITNEETHSDSARDDKDNLPHDIVPLQRKQYNAEQTIKYTVKEAGIILLAPFFQRLFTKLRLYDKSGWTTKDAAYRAVHIIKFLSSDLQQAPEYMLVLEKLLCGLSPDEPVPLEIVLTDEEIDESVSLLKSVLEHWKALRNTSLAGLREAFFKRDGLITRKDNDWLLQVERITLDVLLDSLPWGYSAVSLPWNDYIIYTEW